MTNVPPSNDEPPAAGIRGNGQRGRSNLVRNVSGAFVNSYWVQVLTVTAIIHTMGFMTNVLSRRNWNEQIMIRCQQMGRPLLFMSPVTRDLCIQPRKKQKQNCRNNCDSILYSYTYTFLAKQNQSETYCSNVNVCLNLKLKGSPYFTIQGGQMILRNMSWGCYFAPRMTFGLTSN